MYVVILTHLYQHVQAACFDSMKYNEIFGLYQDIVKENEPSTSR